MSDHVIPAGRRESRDVDITTELSRGGGRPPDYEAENRALARLVRLMSKSPQGIAQGLADAALELCRADSSGISVLEPDRSVFRWYATAGEFAPYLGSTMPRDFSPCGVVLDRNAFVLMAEPVRRYPYIATLEPYITEVLLIPFHRGESPAGTLWVVSHREGKRFDAEDLRVMTSLSQFASAAVQVLGYVEAIDLGNQELRDARMRLDSALKAGAIATWTWDILADRVVADDALARLFGVPPDEAAGAEHERYVRAVHPDDRERVIAAIRAAVDSGTEYHCEYRVVQDEIGARWVSASGKVERDPEGRAIRLPGVVVDVTDRKRNEDATRHQVAQLQRLTEISARINAAHDVETILGTVTLEARVLIGAHQAVTHMVPDPAFPQPTTMVSFSQRFDESPVLTGPDGLDLYESVPDLNQPVRLTQAELERDPFWSALGKSAGAGPPLRGWLAVPLVGRNGRLLGLLQLSDKYEGDFEAEDEALLLQLAHLTSVAIENSRLYEQLRSNDLRKNEFLAMLAHELRNPLAAIGNAATLMAMTTAEEQVDYAKQAILRQTKQLSRLVDDLLDVSRINLGKVVIRPEILEASPIIDSAAGAVSALVAERKHTLEIAIDRGNLWVNVDPARIEQCVVNLLNNAAKYSENGGHISLSARQEGGEVAIRVKDTGVGIPPERLTDMFELFAQGDPSDARSEGGLGIGLTLVKRMIEMHDGTITAASDGLGQGSEFIIRLPAAERPPETAPVARRTTESTSSGRILVVDDNVDTVRGMTRLLKLRGHEVLTAHSGQEAIAVAAACPPDFILLDIGLPGMDGYEVVQRLRRHECCQDATIIAVSGYGRDADFLRSTDAGFDHHLVKPIDFNALTLLLVAKPGD